MCVVSDHERNHERNIGYGSLARGSRRPRRFQTEFPSVPEARSERRVWATTIPSGFGVEQFSGKLKL